ncbi:MAG: rhodanese-like domain-containing protein [Chromatiales bacterium]|nr:rhodanese-like domain-containing protein [Chromatiales bacterium]
MYYLKYSLSALLFVLLLSGCTGELPYSNVDNDELQQLLSQGIPIYDIRRAEEWRETGVVRNSRRLTFFDAQGRVNPGFIPEFTKRINKDDPVILICRTGNRTSAVAKYLSEEMGYTRVYNVTRGITDWISQGREVSGR